MLEDLDFELFAENSLRYDDIMEIVQPLLHDVSYAKKVQVVTKILELAPTNTTDMMFLEKSHLSDILPELRCHRFIAELKLTLITSGRKGNDATCSEDPAPSTSRRVPAGGRIQSPQRNPQVVPQSQPRQLPSQTAQGRSRPRTHYDYVFKETVIPDNLRKICEAEILSPPQRIQVVKALGQECKAKKPSNVHMTSFVDEVTLQFVTKFPKQMDMFNGEIQGSGNKTLHEKVYVWVENNNRKDREGPTKKKKKHTPQMKNWDPSIDPQQREYQENLKSSLSNCYEKPRCEWNISAMREFTKDSYDLQRSDINLSTLQGESIVKEVFDDWPFLFHPIGASVHFSVGESVDVNQVVEAFMAGPNCSLLRYWLLARGGENEVKADWKFQNEKEIIRLRNGDTRSLEILCVLKMLSSKFNENFEQIFLVKNDDFQFPEEGVKLSEAAQLGLNLPETPCFVGKDSSLLKCNSYNFFIDTIRVTKEPITALQAVKCMIPIHFMLNLNYNKKVAKTLEFFQRVVLNVQCPASDTAALMSHMVDFEKFCSFMNEQ